MPAFPLEFPAGIDAGDPATQAFASGMLAGAGLREVSQTLGLSRKRQGNKGGGAMPSASTMLQGNIGDLDRIMLLARLKEAMGAGMGTPGVGAGPIDPMAAMMPGGPGAMPPPGPLPLPLPVGGPGMPPLPIGAIPAPGPAPMPTPGGALPLQMLMRLLSDAQGVI